jgi:hypothetical protein
LRGSEANEAISYLHVGIASPSATARNDITRELNNPAFVITYSGSDREMEFPAEFEKSLKGLLSFSPDFQSRATQA